MRIADLYCGAGGAGMGLHRAGFEVVGFDIEPQPLYPFEFHQQDALMVDLDGFDAVWASPPCQSFSRANSLKRAQGRRVSTLDLLTPTRRRFIDSYPMLPYILENVPGAPLRVDLILCGSSFGLKVRRHRWFESNRTVPDRPSCKHREQGRPVGVYWRPGDSIPGGGRTAATPAEGQQAMGIDWMPWFELTRAVPPVYSEYLGRYLLEQLS